MNPTMKSLALVAALLVLPGVAFAQDETPKAKDLLAKFGEALPGFVEDGDRLFWSDGQAARLPVIGVKNGNPVLETPIGRLAIAKALLKSGHPDALTSLVSLTAVAQQAGLGVDGGKDAGLEFAWDALTGYQLRSKDRIVCAAGVLALGEADGDRAADVQGVKKAIESFRKDLASSALGEHGRRAVVDFVERLGRADGKEELDEVAPSFARRLMRHGWAERISELAGLSATETLHAAVAEGATLRAVKVYSADGVQFRRLENAFGDGTWLLESKDAVAYAARVPVPMYHWPSKRNLESARVVVELPAGVDPMTGAELLAQAKSVSLYHGMRRLATWTPVAGMSVDVEAWRSVYPAEHDHLDENTVGEYMPPHIVLVDPYGDIEALLTENGPLVPPADPSAGEAERFLADAARLLPDAAHLDLIGQYLFAYVYDSPEPTSPLVIGNRETKGDIHQTAVQTLGTVVGGVCRGDCDDLSELYVEIAQRQGRLAYVLNLPAHAAASWAEKREDGWHVFVLQTGPALEFSDEKLPKSLEAAYRSFDATETFDPHALGILLRFSGENTRSQWVLGYRIFAEPEYAATLIDVQKDWHFQTYLQGIQKMKKVIEGGDADTANLRELSSLYKFTGQYALGAEVQRRAIDTCKEPESKLYLSIELIEYLEEIGDQAGIRSLAKDILENQLPAVAGAMERPVQIRVALQIADALVRAEEHELAMGFMSSPAVQAMASIQQNTIQYFSSPRYNERQWLDSLYLRDLLREHVSTCLSILEKAGPTKVATDPVLRQLAVDSQRWVDSIAMRDANDPADRLMRYSTVGDYYAAMIGLSELETRLESVAMPASKEYDHLTRVGGLTQMWLDLPWIKCSIAFWYGAIADAMDADAPAVDKGRLTYLHARLHEAEAATRRLGLNDTTSDYMVHMADVAVSVAMGWDEKLRERLHYVKAQNDRKLRDDTAMWMGDAARFATVESYARAVELWKQELDYKPKYYWIAWRAALTHAPQHALIAAKVAAQQYPDDPDFVAEYEFMQQLYSGK